MGRLLGIDYGERRIGLALSDPEGRVATGLPTLDCRYLKEPPLDVLVRIVAQRGVQEVIVGLPLTLEGQRGVRAEKVASFARSLKGRLRTPVTLWDERLTTARAKRGLREMGVSGRRARSRGKEDEMAAVLLLQSYLDFLRREEAPGETTGP